MEIDWKEGIACGGAAPRRATGRSSQLLMVVVMVIAAFLAGYGLNAGRVRVQ